MADEVSDEMLMAYVDGELDDTTRTALARRLAAEPGLERRAAAFRASRDAVRTAFAAVHAEPVPPALVAAVMRPANVDAPARSVFRPGLALAASLAVVFGIGGFLLGSGTGHQSAPLLADAAMARSLGQLADGGRAALAGGTGEVEAVATLSVEGGTCRIFRVLAPDEALRGVGCDRGAGWRIEMAVQDMPGDAAIPASSGAVAAVDAYLDEIGAAPSQY